MTKNTGTLVGAPIRPYDDMDTFPSALASEIKGGRHSVVNTAVRDAITTDRREWGMIAVLPNGVEYILIENLIDANISNNANWGLRVTDQSIHLVTATVSSVGTTNAFPSNITGIVDRIVIKTGVTPCGPGVTVTFSTSAPGSEVLGSADKSDLNEASTEYIVDIQKKLTAQNIECTVTGSIVASFDYIIYFSNEIA